MSLAAGSALVFLPETMRRAETKIKQEPHHALLHVGAATVVNDEMPTEEATKDQAVWQKWSKLLKVPNLQAVYVRNKLAQF